MTNNEASGSFTDSGVSSGDTYTLYLDKNETTNTDTAGTSTQSDATVKIAFHHGTFSSSDYSSAYSTVGAAATAGHVYSDTSTTPTYTWGTLGTISSTSTNTTYTWTPVSAITDADVLMVAGGGAGGSDNAGGGGAGGLIFKPSTSITGSQTITVGAGAAAVPNESTAGEQGVDTTFGSLTAKGGGCGANGHGTTTPTANMIGGSGGGGDGESGRPTGGTASQSSQSGDSGTYGYGNAGGNGEAAQGAGGGGGGAGTSGAHGSSVTNEIGGVGGDGLKEVTIGGTLYNFATIYGAIYGEVLSGESWFAGGGAGGNNNNKTTDVNGGKGGGGKGLGSDDLTDNIIKYGKAHTGGGGGGGTFGTADTYSGGGGSGIVLVKYTDDIVSGKNIPKVTGISSNSTNVTFSVQQDSGTSITHVKYTVNGGSVEETAVGTLSFAHNLAASASISVVAWAVDTSGNQLSVKNVLSGTVPLPIFKPSHLGSDLDIYCTPSTHATYPSHSDNHGFARYPASDVYSGDTIQKYAYRLFDSGNQSSDGYVNHEIVINVINDANTWEDLGTSDPATVEEVGTTTKYIKCTYGNGSILYFENKASWYI